MNPKHLKALYVDDEPHIREVVRMTIEIQSEWEIETCGSGPEALAIIANAAPDLVILDCMMPEMDGPTVLREMYDRLGRRDIPVIFMTARTLPIEVARLKALGAIGVVGKPFDPMTLCDQLGRLWHDRAAREGEVVDQKLVSPG